jgi:hypothetical protein
VEGCIIRGSHGGGSHGRVYMVEGHKVKNHMMKGHNLDEQIMERYCTVHGGRHKA